MLASAPVDPGLYVHVPFCSAVCPYCDFAVMVGGERRRQLFVEVLSREIALRAATVSSWRFDTLYFGGGTPSALAPERLAEILRELRGVFSFAAGHRTFFEANPEDVTEESLAAWRELGVDTLSLGVQSFDPEALSFLGRRHGPEVARRSVERAVEAGFRTVSVDLIFGLEGQTEERWRRDLETAVALAPQHVSCYQLTIHRGTPFARRQAAGTLREMEEGEQARLFALTHEVLSAGAFEAYEVSNFARGPEHRSAHNRKYWDHTPYLGLGPSAHSFDGRRRSWNERRLSPWRGHIERGEIPEAGHEELALAELALERLMLALRTPAGLDLGDFERRYGVDLAAANGPRFAAWMEEGLIRDEPGRLAPTRAGLAVADGLVREIELPSVP
ncbi:MAG: radical SAM family heme chaperone HemW [Acidobacteriota bacterium]